MDLLIVVIVLLLLFGGGGGLYWGMGAGWGIGPIGLIIAVEVVDLAALAEATPTKMRAWRFLLRHPLLRRSADSYEP